MCNLFPGNPTEQLQFGTFLLYFFFIIHALSGYSHFNKYIVTCNSEIEALLLGGVKVIKVIYFLVAQKLMKPIIGKKLR